LAVSADVKVIFGDLLRKSRQRCTRPSRRCWNR